MSIEVLGRIQDIRSTLRELSGAPAPAQPKPAPASSSSTTGTPAASQFAQQLAAAVSQAAPAPAPFIPPAPPAEIAPVAPVNDPANGDAGGFTDFTAITEKYVGIPYMWGGNDASLGLDCSSFVQHVYRELGYELPRTTWDQINEGTPVASMADAQPGDLLFSFDTGHVAIYLGNNKVIDAPQPGKTIQVRDAWENDGNLSGIRRIIPSAA